MIARVWSARATPAGARKYAAYFRRRVAPALGRIAGHRGALLLRRRAGRAIALRVVTFWASMRAVRRFAGRTADRAVVEDEARAVLAAFDRHVEHFEIVITTQPRRGRRRRSAPPTPD